MKLQLQLAGPSIRVLLFASYFHSYVDFKQIITYVTITRWHKTNTSQTRDFRIRNHDWQQEKHSGCQHGRNHVFCMDETTFFVRWTHWLNMTVWFCVNTLNFGSFLFIKSDLFTSNLFHPRWQSYTIYISNYQKFFLTPKITFNLKLIQILFI